MSEASFWLSVCQMRHAARTGALRDPPPLSADRFYRLLLDEAAFKREPLGVDGCMWTFCDRSSLLATSEGVVIR